MRQVRPRLALGWCQLLLTVATAWSAITLANSLPFWPINPLLSLSPWYTFQLDLARCCWAILPGTILWGASFPLALAAVASPDEDSGKTVGAVYAANTFGAILGALVVSLVLVPWIGTQQTQRVLLVASAVSALIVFVPYVRAFPSRVAQAVWRWQWCWRDCWHGGIGPIPGVLVEYGRKAPIQAQGSRDYRSGGRPQFLGGHRAVERRHDRTRRQRPRAGLQHSLRHEAAAHGGTPAAAAASQSEVGPGHRLRRRSDGRHVHHAIPASRKSPSAKSSR